MPSSKPFTAIDSVQDQLDRILPDYTLVFAVPILAHCKHYESHDDVETLKKFQSALWFLLEPLMVKNENFSFGFYKAMLEKMKTFKDKMHPDNEEGNLVSCT